MSEFEQIVQEGTENTEVTAEQTQIEGQVEQIETPRTYTQEEVDAIVERRLARNSAKIRKEYDNKYGDLETVLRAGTGKESVEEMTGTFREFYQSKGIQIPQAPQYSDRDIEVLAKAEADEIIKAGLEDVIEEVDRLADVGLTNMNPRERAVFQTLAEYRRTAEQGKELSKIGVTEDVYGSKEFRDFAGKFASTTPITEIYEMYSKMQPKKEVRTMGSMRTNTPPDKGVKEFYTRDEAMQFTKKDFDENPELFKAVERSMYKW